jgi:hypothetical protein
MAATKRAMGYGRIPLHHTTNPGGGKLTVAADRGIEYNDRRSDQADLGLGPILSVAER